MMKISCQESEDVFTAYIDFSKPFCKLPRYGLLRKLRNLNIGGCFYKMLKNMYTDNTSFICMRDMLSRPFKYDTGVRKGDSLSPTLFNINVNVICLIQDMSPSVLIILN